MRHQADAFEAEHLLYRVAGWDRQVLTTDAVSVFRSGFERDGFFGVAPAVERKVVNGTVKPLAGLSHLFKLCVQFRRWPFLDDVFSQPQFTGNNRGTHSPKAAIPERRKALQSFHCPGDSALALDGRITAILNCVPLSRWDHSYVRTSQSLKTSRSTFPQ